MKILEIGATPKPWSVQHRCTGWGNNHEGCNALLELDLDDIRFYTDAELPWGSAPSAMTFKCPCCERLTDLGLNDWPQGENRKKVQPFSQAWRMGQK